MEQRPLRLGDIVDDYCPRERRVTNHAIVAVVDDAIRQTRCTTCDAEHVYRGARAPRVRKKETSKTYDEVLASVAGTQLIGLRPEPAGPDRDPDEDQPAVAAGAAAAEDASDIAAHVDGAAAERQESEEPAQADAGHEDGWLAHRPLIRATLPRTETDPPPARPIPEFTMHQRNTRGGQNFRYGQGWNGQGRNGSRPDRFPHGGHGGQGQGQGQGPRQGDGPGAGKGHGRRRRGRGKRSR